MILSIFFILALTILALFFFNNSLKTKQLALSSAGLVLIMSCSLVVSFDTNQYFFQHLICYPLGFKGSDTLYVFGLDGLSV